MRGPSAARWCKARSKRAARDKGGAGLASADCFQTLPGATPCCASSNYKDPAAQAACCATFAVLQCQYNLEVFMKLLITAVLGIAFAIGAQAQTAQQNKMTVCNKEAADKKGDERKAFMKTCLSAKKETPQQAKMKSCNADAKDMKGDERKAFMSQCLKKG